MRCRILSMAYRNHPTRYLIVKDRVASPAVAGGQQEAATYAARIPASSTFFQNPPTRLSAAAFRFPEAEGVFTLPRPARQALFFNHRFARLAIRPRCRFSQRGGSFYASPRGPSTLFFTRPEEPLSLDPRRRFPSARRSVSTLAHPARQRFFSIPPRFLATPAWARRGFPQREGLSTRGTGRRQRFSVPARRFSPRRRDARGCLP